MQEVQQHTVIEYPSHALDLLWCPLLFSSADYAKGQSKVIDLLILTVP